jgi:LasA protease
MKTRSNARRLQLLVAALVMAASVLACSQGYVTPFELTMTAKAVTVVPTQAIPTATNTDLPTATPVVETPVPTFTDLPQQTNTPAPTETFDPLATGKPPIIYYTQSGDTLPSITGRFGVSASEIQSSEPLPETGLINPGIVLTIPDKLENTTSYMKAMPDSEVVYSPSASSFDIKGYIDQAGGYLSRYVEKMGTGNYSGAEIVKLVALENSANPYLLLAILEYKSLGAGGTDQLCRAGLPDGLHQGGVTRAILPVELGGPGVVNRLLRVARRELDRGNLQGWDFDALEPAIERRDGCTAIPICPMV